MFESFMKELLSIFLSKVKEQTFSVLLLLVACGVLGYVINNIKTDVKTLQTELTDCKIARAKIEIAFDALKAQFDAHKEQFIATPKRKK